LRRRGQGQARERGRRRSAQFPLASLIELPDGRVAEWEAIGSGEPLLWIEGGPGLPAHLARADVALIADRFRAHLVNAPGCGRSSPPPDYSLDTHVAYFDEVRRALGLERITVMGHSWGGLVALALTLAVPEAVERLVIIDGYAGDASVPEEIAAEERDRALGRLADRPWLEAALAAFGADVDPTGRGGFTRRRTPRTARLPSAGLSGRARRVTRTGTPHRRTGAS
jgi:pimeloyl-ACP methyl ester carboxylesterase